MKKKRLIALVAMIVALSQIFMAFPAAYADGEREVLSLGLVDITGASFKVYGPGGAEVSPPYRELPQNAGFEIIYAFKVLDAADPADDVKAGDYFSVSLPSELLAIAGFTPVVNAPLTHVFDGETYTVAHLNITAEGVATVTFLDDIENLSDVNFALTIEGAFQEEKISGDEPVSFTLEAIGTIEIIFEEDETPEPPPSATIAKAGSYDPSENEVTWTVTVDPDGQELTGVKVADTLGPNQTFKSAEYSSGGSGSVSYTTEDGIDYVFDLGTVAGVTSFVIKTTPTNGAFGTEGATTTLTNGVALYVDSVPDPLDEDDAEATVTTDWIQKKGQVRTAGSEVFIDWTFTLNNNNRTIPAGSTLTDTIPPHLAFDLGTVKRNGGTPPSEDTAGFDGETGVFTYTFGGDASGVQTITFTTKVLPGYFEQQDQTGFSNSGTLNIYGGGSYTEGSGDVGVGTSLIAKGGKGYDASTQLITWELEVNRNGMTITGAKIVDTLGANQVLDSGFIPVRKDGSTDTPLTKVANTADVTGASNQYHYDETTRVLTIYLGDLASADHPYITFKTRVTTPEDYANNKTTTYYNNSAVLTGGGITTSTVTSTTQTVVSQVIAKAAAGYDYTNRELSWKITVNQNKMTMPDAEVKDFIQPGQEYVEGSLRIDGAEPGARLSVSGNELTITLGAITAQTEITFKTRVTDPGVFLETNGNVTFRNNAELTSGISGAPTVSVWADSVVNNKSIDKNVGVEYTRDNGYIGWEVFINANQAPLQDASLSDTLVDGLDLDSQSVELRYWNQDAAGNRTVGDPVPAEAYSFTYSAVTREFVIHLPDGPQGYRLAFNTDVLKAGKYSNTIAFSGSYTGSDSAESTQYVASGDVDFSSSGWNGSIRIVKVDPSGNRIASGAVFELLDSAKNVKAVLTTDANGEAAFTRLKLRTYYIREKSAPEGYLLDGAEHMVTLTNDSAETRNQTVRITNDPLTASITLRKTNAGGLGLSGGSFGIYAAGDTGFASPIQTAHAVNGVVTFADMAPGDYRIREISAPLGYSLSPTVISASLVYDPETGAVADVQIEEPLVNHAMLANVVMKKTDEHGAPLSGGLFAIYHAVDSTLTVPVQTAKAVDGVVRFTGLTVGDYKIRELEAPKGYVLSDIVVNAPLVLDFNTNSLPDLIIEAPFVNHTAVADVSIKKTDERGAPLSGGLFGIYSAADGAFASPLQTAGASNGVVRFTRLPEGDYVIREIEAPRGYAKSNAAIPVSLKKDGEGRIADANLAEALVNRRIYGSVELRKVDGYGSPLAGAEFGLYDSDGSLVMTARSNGEGLVLFTGVPGGDYTVKELSAPRGYVRSDSTAEASVTDSGVAKAAPYEIVNQVSPSLYPDDDIPGGTTLPQTGSPWDSTVLLALGALLILAGGLLLLRPGFGKKKQ